MEGQLGRIVDPGLGPLDQASHSCFDRGRLVPSAISPVKARPASIAAAVAPRSTWLATMVKVVPVRPPVPPALNPAATHRGQCEINGSPSASLTPQRCRLRSPQPMVLRPSLSPLHGVAVMQLSAVTFSRAMANRQLNRSSPTRGGACPPTSPLLHAGSRAGYRADGRLLVFLMKTQQTGTDPFWWLGGCLR